MEETKTCKHPSCSCLVLKDGPYGGYCSDHCKAAADKTEIKCDCKHAGCN